VVQLGSTPASDLVEHGGEVAIECRRARCGVAVSRSKRPLQWTRLLASSRARRGL